jgi:hypothetical protein
MNSGLNRRQFATQGLRSLTGFGLGSFSVFLSGCAEKIAGHPQPRPKAVPGALGEVSRFDYPREWRALQRISYGPQPGLFERVCRIGADSFIDEQLAPDSIEEDEWLSGVLARFTSLNLSPDEAQELETFRRKDRIITPLFQKLLQLPLKDDETDPDDGIVSTELRKACILRAAYSRRQLKEIMVEFWNDHFNIFQRKGECLWLKTVNDRLVRENAMGHFRDLLAASMTSPAMLVYLDNTENRFTEIPYEKLNENYARELLELHTLGVDSGYVLRDVQEVARCLSGWGVRKRFEYRAGEVRFNAAYHDDLSKTVLGTVIPAGGGIHDVDRVLDVLCEHPSTARFVASKLCRRFVGDGKFPELVERLSQVYRETRGHIGAMLKCLFHSDEFQDPQNLKLKRPFDFVVSAVRALDVTTTGDALELVLKAMGHVPFGWPKPDGYPDSLGSWKDGLLGRWNFAVAIASGQLEDTSFDAHALFESTGTTDRFRQLQRLAIYMIGAALPEKTASGLARLVQGASGQDAEKIMLALILSSEQFQWRS